MGLGGNGGILATLCHCSDFSRERYRPGPRISDQKPWNKEMKARIERPAVSRYGRNEDLLVVATLFGRLERVLS